MAKRIRTIASQIHLERLADDAHNRALQRKERKMKTKPMTTGERIEISRCRVTLGRPNLTLEEFRTKPVYAEPRRSAKSIDSAIRRAEKEAAWDVMLNRPEENVYDWMERKYGPKPTRKAVVAEYHVQFPGYSWKDSSLTRPTVEAIASRFNIAPEELEEKRLTVEDIVAVPGARLWYVRCGGTDSQWFWREDKWVQYDPAFHAEYANLSRFNAEAIASKLRADGNVPGAKGVG